MARFAAQRLLVPVSGKLVLLDFDEIAWIEAHGNYSQVHAQGKPHRMRTTMKDLLARLPAGKFMRVHRSAVVNLGWIRELELEGSKRYLVLTSGERIRISRDQWKQLKARLSSPIAA